MQAVQGRQLIILIPISQLLLIKHQPHLEVQPQGLRLQPEVRHINDLLRHIITGAIPIHDLRRQVIVMQQDHRQVQILIEVIIQLQIQIEVQVQILILILILIVRVIPVLQIHRTIEAPILGLQVVRLNEVVR